MRQRAAALAGFGLGAGFMYFLDPQVGRRRRARARDELAHALSRGADALDKTARDLAHRTSGIIARTRGALRPSALPPGDDVLAQRVRTRLGRLVSHAHAIDVEASDGRVTLRGPILRAESGALVRAVRRVAGVREVVNALDEHAQPGSVPALQGGGGRRPALLDVRQRHWAPATRLLVGSAGVALAGYGAARRDAAGALLAVTGVGLFARAATNLETRRLTGIGAGRRAVDVEKTITVDAAPEDVFEFWTSYENFPRFMSRVLDVQPSAHEGQSRWRVAGPAGVPVAFDAEVSAFVENRAFGWRTLEGAPVAHAWLVHFEPVDDGRTRIHLRMSYNPPGGWWGHALAEAFGVDPKSNMDADLARMKTLLETGRPARDAAQPD
ncbi:MAG TPA: SRPBCC family protein [Myxococcota bacterium]|nr:SRPBCC family protein [Myxococcota bacterium]